MKSRTDIGFPSNKRKFKGNQICDFILTWSQKEKVEALVKILDLKT